MDVELQACNACRVVADKLFRLGDKRYCGKCVGTDQSIRESIFHALEKQGFDKIRELMPNELHHLLFDYSSNKERAKPYLDMLNPPPLLVDPVDRRLLVVEPTIIVERLSQKEYQVAWTFALAATAARVYYATLASQGGTESVTPHWCETHARALDEGLSILDQVHPGLSLRARAWALKGYMSPNDPGIRETK